MQFTAAFFALSGLALAAAVPQSLTTERLAGRSPEDTLYVTFWKDGCGITGSGKSSTFYVSM